MKWSRLVHRLTVLDTRNHSLKRAHGPAVPAPSELSVVTSYGHWPVMIKLSELVTSYGCGPVIIEPSEVVPLYGHGPVMIELLKVVPLYGHVGQLVEVTIIFIFKVAVLILFVELFKFMFRKEIVHDSESDWN